MIRRLDILIALYVLGLLFAELFGAKTIPLINIGGWHVNGSVALLVLPLLFTVTDVIVEVYGKKRARSVVFSGLMMVGLLVILSAIAVNLPPSVRFAPNEAAYDTIFGASIRISLASLAAFAFSELLDVFIFSKLREKLGKKALWFRNNASNFVAQFVDSAVFLTLAFYAFGMSFGSNMSFIVGLLIPYWIIRCLLSAFQTPLVYLGVWWLRGEKLPADKMPADSKA